MSRIPQDDADAFYALEDFSCLDLDDCDDPCPCCCDTGYTITIGPGVTVIPATVSLESEDGKQHILHVAEGIAEIDCNSRVKFTGELVAEARVDKPRIR